MYKTHTNGELRASHIAQTVTLAGWVHRVRDHGGVKFIDLRDRFGLVQVVVNPDNQAAAQIAEDLRAEWVIQVFGEVRSRPAGNENPNLPTGEIEVVAREIRVLNQAKPLPFQINKDEEVDENLRLKYRYLDLRRERMRRNLELRSRVEMFIR
ncbi:MAG: OB-fold nucleic acid binding domain-containing protein, partial [Patescibacteria group bacterium]|nr:OB-fold nucleic acid binding domain-containing protein [Patescibacteria group bacterium]